NHSGEYIFLPMDIFSGMGKNPFVAENRQTDIDFGFSQVFTMKGTLQLVHGYEFEELPKNLKMILPDSSIAFKRIVQKSDQLLNYSITLEILRPQFAADEYSMIREIYKRLLEVLGEHIVIKKSYKPMYSNNFKMGKVFAFLAISLLPATCLTAQTPASAKGEIISNISQKDSLFKNAHA